MQKQSNRPQQWIKIYSIDGREAQEFLVSHVAKRTGYHIKTVKSWANGAPIPPPAHKLLAMLMLGCFPVDAGSPWIKWRSKGNFLYNGDNGQSYDAGMIRQDWLTWQRLHDALGRIERLNDEIERLKGIIAQPLQASFDFMLDENPAGQAADLPGKFFDSPASMPDSLQ